MSDRVEQRRAPHVSAASFVVTWLVALTLWRVLDLEARWTPETRP